VIDSKIALVLFATMFVVLTSFMATELGVEGINCSDPADLVTEPGTNTTSVSKIIDAGNSVVDIFFGCSSSNPLVNGLFISLQVGMIIVLLYLAKDLVPFT
jgi:hypothetical protein